MPHPPAHLLRTGHALLMATHPGPAAAVTALAAGLCRSAHLPRARAVAVVGAVGSGQLLIGWSNDLIDVRRDRLTDRLDKPVARGEVSPRAVARAAAGACALNLVASRALGGRAALTQLATVASGLAHNLGVKGTWASPAPYAIAFGLLPSVVTLALPQPALAPRATTVGAALLGVGAHLVNALPDLEDDRATGVPGLPHRLGEGVSRLLVGSTLAASAFVLALDRRPLGRAERTVLAASLALAGAAARDRGRGHGALAAVVGIAAIDLALLGASLTEETDT